MSELKPVTQRNVVLVIGSGSKFEVAQKITGPTVDWQSDEHSHTGVHKIDTKYYTADLEFVVCKAQELSKPTFVEELGPRVDGLIVHFASPTSEYFTCLTTSWVPNFIEEYAPSVLLGLTNEDVEGEEFHGQLRDWFYENQFELVNLSEEPSTDPEDRFEKYGVDRVVEALQSNMWENMVHKAAARPPKGLQAELSTPSDSELVNVSHADSQVHPDVLRLVKLLSTEELEPQPKPTDVDPNKLVTDDDLDLEKSNFDSLENALRQIKSIREQASKLPDDQRRAMAAQTALAFMKMMGDDDDDFNFEDDDDI